MSLKVAVIGCGWAGTRHAAAFARHGATLLRAVDTDRERAERLARSYPGMIASSSYHDALHDPEVDAVTICLPHNLHAEVAVAAARQRKHILCEKPLAASLNEADRMIAAADEHHITLMVAENVRYSPLFRKIRALLDDGVIGQVALVQLTREAYLRTSFLQDRRWFLDQRAAAGGIMMSGGIHDFETMRMLVGEIESVYALRSRQRFSEMEGDDTSTALVRFSNGAAGTLVESFLMKSLTTASGPEVHTLRLDGDLGSIVTLDGKTIRFYSEHEAYLMHGAPLQHELVVPEEDTFEIEIGHFIESVQSGSEPITGGRSQRKPLEIVLAAYRSMQTGHVIQLDEDTAKR